METEVIEQAEKTENYSGRFVYDGKKMRKHGMSEGERLLCKAYGVNKLEITKGDVLEIRDELIEGVGKGVINEEMLYSYIEQNHGTPDAGLVSTVLCMSILPKELTERGNLEKKSQESSLELSPFRRLARAHETAFKEQYGFFAYTGDYFNGAESHQMKLGHLDIAEKFSGNAGEGMTATQEAWRFRDNAGKGMTATRESDSFSGNAGEGMTAQRAYDFRGNAGKGMTAQRAYDFRGNAGEGMTATQEAWRFRDNAGEGMTATQEAWRFRDNAGKGMTAQRAYDFRGNAGEGMTAQRAYDFRGNAGARIKFPNTRFPRLKKIGFYLKRKLNK